MLASITPLGERARHSRWSVTVTAFVLGATATGAVTGASLGALGSVAISGVSSHARLAVLAVAVAVAIALDTVPSRVPGPRRQVNERWLDEYRGWVYGLGYGAQLGLGVSTVVSSAATYAALVAAFLSGSAASGAIVFGCFGAVRGLTPLAATRVRTPAQLLAVHVMLTRWRTQARWSVVAMLGTILLLALVGGLG